MVLPLLDVSILRSAYSEDPHIQTVITDAPLFSITHLNQGIDTKLKVIDGEFFLLEGSKVAAECTLTSNTDSSSYTAERIKSIQQKLLSEGSLILDLKLELQL
ncbi:hypothetical protein EML15_04900 [Corynebacterium sp. sy017]|uniref:hypothetical protein n=1 Tax=unclassified Corynebacterium TaxID=2624378 RepID=UPI00118506CF|nr:MULTISPECIES: hypothetical protein [unclassified Corynebacterium]MBP3088483.1 hypothetical protein [Corynebacterium sp. sy017]TSD91790.1 hypothetical protein ELY17_04900 [Corynebacterium sp. SY003]